MPSWVVNHFLSEGLICFRCGSRRNRSQNGVNGWAGGSALRSMSIRGLVSGFGILEYDLISTGARDGEFHSLGQTRDVMDTCAWEIRSD